MKVSEQTIEDLLKAFDTTTVDFGFEILQIVKETQSYLEDIDTPYGEIRALRRMKKKYLERYTQMNKRKNFGIHFEHCVKLLLAELHNYLPEFRASMIDAALKKITETNSIAERLKRMVPEVKAAWQKLDARTIAALKVLETLMSIDGEINTDYINVLFDCVDGDVSVLRSEPALESMVEAYDLACAYRAAID